MTTASEEETSTEICASCGKAGGNLKRCSCCKSINMMVHYCNRDCQKSHRKAHVLECRRRKDELERATLASTPPPKPECPICMLPLPLKQADCTYMACCGKLICNGCSLAHTLAQEQNAAGHICCAFCRKEPPRSVSEYLAALRKRVDMNDTRAMVNLAEIHRAGDFGLPKNEKEAFELFQRASGLGDASADYILSLYYQDGLIVERSKTQETEFLRSAANKGHVAAQINLANVEIGEGNIEAAVFYLRMAASAGHDVALNNLEVMYENHLLSEDELSDIARAFAAAQDATKSENRDMYAQREQNGRCRTSSGILGV